MASGRNLSIYKLDESIQDSMQGMTLPQAVIEKRARENVMARLGMAASAAAPGVVAPAAPAAAAARGAPAAAAMPAWAKSARFCCKLGKLNFYNTLVKPFPAGQQV